MQVLCKLLWGILGHFYATFAAFFSGSGTVAHRGADFKRRQRGSSRFITSCIRYTPLLVFLNRLAAFVRKRTDANGDSITFVVRR